MSNGNVNTKAKIESEHNPSRFTFTIRVNGKELVTVHSQLLCDAHLMIIEGAFRAAKVEFETSAQRTVGA